jgi:hypothetical protein
VSPARRKLPPANPYQKTVRKWVPARIEGAKREYLISELSDRLDTARNIEPHVKPHVERHKQFVAIAVRLQGAIESARAELLALGVNQLIVKDMGRDESSEEFVPRDNPGRGLRMDCDDALKAIGRWLHFYGSERGAPKALKTLATEELWRVSKRYGVSKKEFEELLALLHQDPTSPKLATTSALAQSRRRAKAKGVGHK